ncbi:MAG: DEAD/DEAH box helicase [Planctomycetes bacterium]|nr:DEAD/DEAH box helicase [Planctomycetota bacterium]
MGGLTGAALGRFLAAALEAPKAKARVLLVVVPDAARGDAVRLDVEAFLGAPAHPFPVWPTLSGREAPDTDVVVRRARVLEALRAATPERPVVVVAPLAALVQEVPSPAAFAAAHVRLAPGTVRSLDVLLEHFAHAGLARVGAVEGPGEMAVRGGVLDVWTFAARGPWRLDFFGDEIESIRELDPSTQRSGEEQDAVDLLVLPPEHLRDPVDAEHPGFLLDHLPADAPVALVEQEALVGAATTLGASAGSGGVAGSSGAERVQRLEAALAARRTWVVGPDPVATSQGFDVGAGSLERLRGAALRGVGPRGHDHAKQLAETLRDVLAKHREVVLFRRADGEQERLEELLAEQGVVGRPTWRHGSLSRSFTWPPTDTAYVAYDDLVDLPLRDRRTQELERRSRPVEDFLELQPGGLVVHRHHGIGLFHGLTTIEGPDGPGDFLELGFAEGTRVFVPVHRIDLVQRYVGTGRTPKLSKLGGTEWAKRTKKVADAVEALAVELLATQAQRAVRQGPPLGPDGPWQHELESAFGHDDTPDQVAGVRAIKQDLEGEKPMDRLLCGDVGYGKTEVALRAVFKVLAAGKQAAILVPTKVLAQQHLRTFRARFAPYPFEVAALTSLEGAATNRQTIRDMAEGRVDLVIGTHRLLGKDVKFQKLGLVVVDEEQRFGVQHKERLKGLRADVDVLSLSATPIPRTLHMALLGLRDISNLATPPLGRHPIETKVAREEDALVRDALLRERARGGQIFVVNPRIRDLPLVERWLLDLVPDLAISTIHGRMDKQQVENRLLRFLEGRIDLLLATTVIESGLDVANANTIVIRDAHRYGLAELHQLRGRVGRERRRAHALLLVPPDQGLKPEARERLRAIEEYSELGAGFQIAMRDLEIRGAGNLLGPQQSGHIAAVGYDLYCRLLADAVAHAKGRPVSRPKLADLGVELPGGVPAGYVDDVREMFRLVRRIAGISKLPELDAWREEMADRFGPVPEPVERLLLAQAVRIAAGAIGVERVDPGPRGNAGVILVAKEEGLARILDRLDDARALDARKAYLPLRGGPPEGGEDLLRRLLQRLGVHRDDVPRGPKPRRRRR